MTEGVIGGKTCREEKEWWVSQPPRKDEKRVKGGRGKQVNRAYLQHAFPHVLAKI
jgi:hypothetical protein